MIPRRLSSSKREQLYDAEAAKAREAGRGELPICNICDCPINGLKQAWDESHEKHKPRWLGGAVEGISHRRCNRLHNNTHDTPLYAKSKPAAQTRHRRDGFKLAADRRQHRERDQETDARPGAAGQSRDRTGDVAHDEEEARR